MTIITTNTQQSDIHRLSLKDGSFIFYSLINIALIYKQWLLFLLKNSGISVCYVAGTTFDTSFNISCISVSKFNNKPVKKLSHNISKLEVISVILQNSFLDNIKIMLDL